jgi:hypothetical protein
MPFRWEQRQGGPAGGPDNDETAAPARRGVVGHTVGATIDFLDLVALIARQPGAAFAIRWPAVVPHAVATVVSDVIVRITLTASRTSWAARKS